MNKTENKNKKVCHKFPPMMTQKQGIIGQVETTVSPLMCFGEICSYWCGIDEMCIDGCNHVIEHVSLPEKMDGEGENGDEDDTDDVDDGENKKPPFILN